MSDIEVAELKRKEKIYHTALANIEEKLLAVPRENDAEIKELRKLREEIDVWFYKVIDYYNLRNNPEMDPFIKELLMCPRYHAVMAWAMRRRR